jgi:hypothetical protein
MAIPIEILITAGSLIGAGGCAWGGTKAALNGTRQRVKEIAEKLDAHIAASSAQMTAHAAHDAEVQLELVERQARIEGKIDLLLERR